MTSTLVEREANNAVRLDAWRRVFEKTNRIISERPVTVNVVPAVDIPYGMTEVVGWTDGEKIHLNGPMVLTMLAKRDPVAAVLRLKGLNYHELSHVLYTPRMTDELPKRVIDLAKQDHDNTWWYAMNALEDQRIETWFTTTYGPSRRYFEATVLQWIVEDGGAEAAILTYGRKYLPASLRVRAGRVFMAKHGKPLYDEFCAVIDAYLLVDPVREAVKALVLVKKFHALIQRMVQQQGHLPQAPVQDNGCHGGRPDKNDPTAARKGRVLVKVAKAAQDKVKDALPQDAADVAQAEADLDAAQQQQSDGDGGADSGQPTEGGGQPADAAAQGAQGPADAAVGGGAGAGDGVADHQPLQVDQEALKAAMDDLVDAAADDLDGLRDDDALMQDVDRVLDAVKAVENNGQHDVAGKNASGNGCSLVPDSDVNVAWRRVAGVLRQIRLDAEPEVLRRQPVGRLDVKRVLQRQAHELDLFRVWDEGAEDEAGMEVVVLLDVSGSMAGMRTDASKAVWVLKRAMDKLSIPCTVMLYDTNHSVLYRPGDRAKPNDIPVLNTGGGTDPSSALEQAHLLFRKSHATNKVLVTVTDGQWFGGNTAHDRVKAMNKMGVTSMLLGLADAYKHNGKHEHTFGADMASPADLPKIAGKLVAQIMRTATQHG